MACMELRRASRKYLMSLILISIAGLSVAIGLISRGGRSVHETSMPPYAERGPTDRLIYLSLSALMPEIIAFSKERGGYEPDPEDWWEELVEAGYGRRVLNHLAFPLGIESFSSEVILREHENHLYDPYGNRIKLIFQAGGQSNRERSITLVSAGKNRLVEYLNPSDTARTDDVVCEQSLR